MKLAITLFFVVQLSAALACASDCSPAVAALEPVDLSKDAADQRAEGLPGAERCASAEISPGTLVAAYYAASAGAVRVIKTGTPPAVLFTIPSRAVSGSYPGVRALDVDGDNSNEAVVSFTDARGTVSMSIFRWDGAKLTLIGPAKPDPDGDPESILTNAYFVDIHGNGKLSVVDHKVRWDGRDSDGNRLYERINTLYDLEDGTYKTGKKLLFSDGFVRGSGAPRTQSVIVSGGSGCTTSLLVVNGNENKANRVSSAEITLNDALVVRPDQFNQNVPSINAQIKIVPGVNTLAAKLAGAPNSEITVIIKGCE